MVLNQTVNAFGYVSNYVGATSTLTDACYVQLRVHRNGYESERKKRILRSHCTDANVKTLKTALQMYILIEPVCLIPSGKLQSMY